MRCAHCQMPIRPGMEMVKRVEFRAGIAYGENMPGGSLEKGAAIGLSMAGQSIEKIQHQKCYWVVWKRENRGGDANLGTRPGLLDPYAEDEDD